MSNTSWRNKRLKKKKKNEARHKFVEAILRILVVFPKDNRPKDKEPLKKIRKSTLLN